MATAASRREAAERLAREHGREFVWVTDAYVVAEGGEVVETYFAVAGTGEVSDRVRDEWMMFDDPNEALDHANDVVADVSEPARYDVIPLEPWSPPAAERTLPREVRPAGSTRHRDG